MVNFSLAHLSLFLHELQDLTPATAFHQSSPSPQSATASDNLHPLHTTSLLGELHHLLLLLISLPLTPLAHAVDLVACWPLSHRLPSHHRVGHGRGDHARCVRACRAAAGMGRYGCGPCPSGRQRVEPWPWAQYCVTFLLFRILIFQFKLQKFFKLQKKLWKS
jgi:hypothetical protein